MPTQLYSHVLKGATRVLLVRLDLHFSWKKPDDWHTDDLFSLISVSAHDDSRLPVTEQVFWRNCQKGCGATSEHRSSVQGAISSMQDVL